MQDRGIEQEAKIKSRGRRMGNTQQGTGGVRGREHRAGQRDKENKKIGTVRKAE